MDIFRANSKLALSTWDDKLLVMFGLSPARPDKAKGQPKAGDVCYDYDKKVNISLNAEKMLRISYHLMLLAYNIDTKYEQYADPSKSQHATGEKKKLTISSGKDNGISIYLSQGENKVGITVGADEAYAIAKWLEATATRYINNPGLLKKDETPAA
jgi:hypothetical protein